MSWNAKTRVCQPDADWSESNDPGRLPGRSMPVVRGGRQDILIGRHEKINRKHYVERFSSRGGRYLTSTSSIQWLWTITLLRDGSFERPEIESRNEVLSP